MAFKLHIPKCPHCDKPAVGTSDMIPAIAKFDGDPAAGTVDYCGESEVLWDGQYNVVELAKFGKRGDPLALRRRVKKSRQIQVVCEDGHEWITVFDVIQ